MTHGFFSGNSNQNIFIGLNKLIFTAIIIFPMGCNHDDYNLILYH